LDFVAKIWGLFHRPLKPIGPERIIEGNIKEVMLKLDLALGYRDLGCGSWLTWKGSGSGPKSYTMSFKFRPQSYSGTSVITAKLPFSLHFVINQTDSATRISWAYKLDDPTFQDSETILKSTEEIIDSLLTDKHQQC
jgi:hypothetical protein